MRFFGLREFRLGQRKIHVKAKENDLQSDLNFEILKWTRIFMNCIYQLCDFEWT